MADTFAFAAAMQATVQWTLENLLPPKIPGEKKSNAGRPPTYKLKMYYICPQKGHHVAPLKSCKAKSGQKCGFQARFNIFLHLATDSLWVEWFLRHSHKLNTLKDMENTPILKATHNWVCSCVDSGLRWDSIQDLLSSQDLDVLCKTTAAFPEANGVTQDLVCNLVQTRKGTNTPKDQNVFKSLTLWQTQLNNLGWHTFAPALIDLDEFLFCFQSPWQQQMMMVQGTKTIMGNATHSTVKNCFLTQGQKASLYT
ncbi:hypothetical protein PTTG_30140, partial [Puccinia triticina 1-1 BBBD Race 1]